MPASNHECTITLTVRETAVGAERCFQFDVLLDGQPVRADQRLTPEQSRAERDFAARFGALFESHQTPGIRADLLQALGRDLFDLWLKPAWAQITPSLQPGVQRLLVVASDQSAVLNLPWELLRPPGDDFLGLDQRFSIRRTPWLDRPLAAAASLLPPRPLRILFLACAPQDQPSLDYEREEEQLLKAIARAGPNVVVDSGDLGSFDELRQRVDEFRPHVVQLTGHAIVQGGLGYFAFEDERGRTDLRSSDQLRREIFAGSGVQCVFVSGCQAGLAPPVAALGGLCQSLVGGEVPLAIGWAASIADPLATRLTTVFYDALARGQSVDRALVQGRHAIYDEATARADPSWTLPVLYAATSQDQVCDFDPRRRAEPPARDSQIQYPLPGMTEGYTSYFVGRRREIQRLLPALIDGSLQTVLLTGLGGAGKSTLATRLTRRLEATGFVPITLSSSDETPLSAAALLEACGSAFIDAGLRDSYALVRDPTVAVADRLRHIVTALNRGRFVLVVDNYEANLDEATRRHRDPELAVFYTYLLTHLAGTSRVLITTRYPPGELATLPVRVQQETLTDFPESSFLKFLLRDDAVERRYHSGELPPELLSKLHRLLGGTPRFLDQIRGVLRTLATDDLTRELDAIELPGSTEPGQLQIARDAYCNGIFTTRLYAQLSPDSRAALSRAAVYRVPVSLEALAAVAGQPVEQVNGFAREWRDYALAYPETGRAEGELWSIYGLLRGWLLDPPRLSPDERRAAHQAAGDFLRELDQQDREGELALSWVDCLLEARAHYLIAGAYEQARLVTDRVSGSLTMQGFYEQVAPLNYELVDYSDHPRPRSWIARAYLDRADYGSARTWYERSLAAAGDQILDGAAVAWYGLATIDLYEGNYAAAREQFGRALEIEQEIGDRAGEAATWHQLASIDGNEGNYAAAREQFGRALEIKQAIEDWAGEAATWHQLATIDLREGNYAAAREQFGRALATRQAIGDRWAKLLRFTNSVLWHRGKAGRPRERGW